MLCERNRPKSISTDLGVSGEEASSERFRRERSGWEDADALWSGNACMLEIWCFIVSDVESSNQRADESGGAADGLPGRESPADFFTRLPKKEKDREPFQIPVSSGERLRVTRMANYDIDVQMLLMCCAEQIRTVWSVRLCWWGTSRPRWSCAWMTAVSLKPSSCQSAEGRSYWRRPSSTTWSGRPTASPW